MLFNSIHFAIFLPVVFALHWFLAARSRRAQNTLLLVASYFFYACWDWRFLFLLLFSTMLDYYSGLKIAGAGNKAVRKCWLWLSILINLGILGVFKYYNFFAESFAAAIGQLGLRASPSTLNLILPVGISFYTFHGLSYIIDVYKGKIDAERNVADYALFVSFFPLLVAGPIERATHLLPQLRKLRTFDYGKAVDGLRQILWGLVKKMIIADNCGEQADLIFANPSAASGSTLLLGAFYFSMQIYGDFSGYSDIALGTARLFGIDLLRNFAYPYFSRDIAEFWRRWHISLSSWFRDYVYIPLGGSRGTVWMRIRNVFIIFILSGLWHGANWTFVAWGTLHALFFLPLMLTSRNRDHLSIVPGRYLPSFPDAARILLTFSLVMIGWIFFRADDIGQAFVYLSQMFSISLFTTPAHFSRPVMLLVFLFLIVEWLGRKQEFAIAAIGWKWRRPLRWVTYSLLVFLIGMFMKTEKINFIYFQF
jgi:alginate O-acetyltransferase complex protein AlgI